MSKVYSITLQQNIPAILKRPGIFSATQKSLQPLHLKNYICILLMIFSVTEMYEGQNRIKKCGHYFNIPVYWMTEITHVDIYKFFVDEQRFWSV